MYLKLYLIIDGQPRETGGMIQEWGDHFHIRSSAWQKEPVAHFEIGVPFAK